MRTLLKLLFHLAVVNAFQDALWPMRYNFTGTRVQFKFRDVIVKAVEDKIHQNGVGTNNSEREDYSNGSEIIKDKGKNSTPMTTTSSSAPTAHAHTTRSSSTARPTTSQTTASTSTSTTTEYDWKSLELDDNGSACIRAAGPISKNKHVYAENGLPVQRIAFSSSYEPSLIKDSDKFWEDIRNYQPDVWLWLGDNMRSDTNNINLKRKAYNDVRDETSYTSHGPIKADDEIPVMATWDDHDCCTDNAGSDFPCLKESQDEFVVHFNLPSTDPRHKDFPGGQQKGVYNSRLFTQPGSVKAGVHVIMLDARTGRDPTYERSGDCKGVNTKMLSDEQWSWLDYQLLKVKSEVKIIASGIQVLPPTNMERNHHDYCSYDIHNQGVDQEVEYEDFFLNFYDITKFRKAIEGVGENEVYWDGTEYESWAEIPREREKLLRMAQQSINRNKTKAIVFVTGDQHWGELMAKKMPASEEYGQSQVLYEVTANGMTDNRMSPSHNSNRLRTRSADHAGDGPFNNQCQFPFIYDGIKYYGCTTVSNGNVPWCSLLTDPYGEHIRGFWGNCAPTQDELAQKTFSNSTHFCTASKFEICSAAGNYGTIDVDFARRKLKMKVRTPIGDEEMWHEISY